jgi:acetylornithine deacetylase/succinyl-diaminopimelate desuccinylase-like protein
MGVRGMLYLELTAKCANRDLHSGNWGGPIPDAVWQMVELLSTLRESKTGRILLEGFYDKVRLPTEDERNAVRVIPLNRTRVARQLGLDKNDLPSSEEFYERLMFQPTLNICGFSSGYVGMGMKTIIPSIATVKIDFRLVADQSPEEVFDKLIRHIKGQTRYVTVRKLDQTKPSRTPINNRYTKSIVEAVRQATGEEPLIIPSAGGTLPLHVFTRTLDLPAITVPYANFDEMNHAPNENLVISNFVEGVKCCAAVLDRLSLRASSVD